MQDAKVLVSDGGPHHYEQWAYVTASKIVDSFAITPHSPNRLALEIAKDRARAEIYEVMLRHHQAVQQKERAVLSAGDHARLLTKWNPDEHTDGEEAVAEVCAALRPLLAKASNLEMFNETTGLPINNRPVTQEIEDMVRASVYSDLNTVIDIERGWHADKHIDSRDEAHEYRRRRNEGA